MGLAERGVDVEVTPKWNVGMMECWNGVLRLSQYCILPLFQ
jgi:hypothetical protein